MVFGHWGQSSKSGLRTLLVGTAVLGGFYFFSHKNSKAAESQLSCPSVISIFKWSVEHHGLREKTAGSVISPKKWVDQLLKKLDPHSVLFLENEVGALNRETERNWAQLISQGDCQFFKQWLKTTIPVAQSRLKTQMTNWVPSENKYPTEKKPLEVTYDRLAQTKDELLQRQEKFLQETYTDIPLQVRASYKQQNGQLFKDRLEDWFKDLNQEAGLLLAKTLLATLDPYSTYFSKNEFTDFYEDLSGNSAGIGIEVQKTLSGLGVTAVSNSSPAEKHGVEVGDEILTVNGVALEKLSFSECTDLLRGQENTPIELTIKKPNNQMAKTFHLMRTAQVFQDKRITTRWLESRPTKKIAMITIPSFYGRGGLGESQKEENSSSEDLRKALFEIANKKSQTDAVVLDLRGNPGGYLEEAITMAGFFLGPKVVVGVSEKKNIKKLHSDLSGSRAIYQGPLIVWVDEETASAGEVLAAALKDYQRAILVGAPTTFGKGSVQKMFQLDDPFLDIPHQMEGGVVKLTTSIFFSPMGHTPLNGGVSTHISISERKQTTVAPVFPSKVTDIAPLMEPRTLENLKERESLLNEEISNLLIKQKEVQDQPVLSQVVEIAKQLGSSGSLRASYFVY